MNKAPLFIASRSSVALLCLCAIGLDARADQAAIIHETPQEFFASTDFDRDGMTDVVIVDKDSGKYRLGYLGTNGLYNWVDNRVTGIKGVSGFSIGPVLSTDKASLVFTGPDANQFAIVEAANPTAPSRAALVPFSDGMGPNTVVAVDIGGEGNTPVSDLFVSSIYNSPEENLITLHRNKAGEFDKMLEAPTPGPIVRANRLSVKPGAPELLTAMVREGEGSTFFVADLSSGKLTRTLEEKGLPANVEYSIGSLKSPASYDLAFFQPGDAKITLRSLEQTAPGKAQLSAPAVHDLGEPVKDIVILNKYLLAIHGQGEKAGLFSFAADKPRLLQAVVATNFTITGAQPTKDGFVLFARSATSKFSTRYFLYTVGADGARSGAYGALATLADNDNITVPEIHKRIVGKAGNVSETAMQLYTNTIPGTRVTYVMVPIKGGEYVMGTPDSEKDRKPDEGPQHKVKISPFWMQQVEVTWSEYELFMYPDQEKRSRTTSPTDEAGDKLADAVTHPSKPYVEMSFGMGKEGFPAIAMTQHAANKYCQWLSAKTGEFYRLPTEAEWEYACRAGTTTRYSFGDEDSKLGEYAWYEENSDFKYQKVGKKKPNPWGLYDMHGNVTEWVLDQYDAEWYQKEAQKGVSIDPWNKATLPYPHSVRGGSWDDEAKSLRSGARRGSNRSWKMQDPQLPKSIWYFSDAQFVGFRIVRPLKVPSAEEMQKYWSSGVERD